MYCMFEQETNQQDGVHSRWIHVSDSNVVHQGELRLSLGLICQSALIRCLSFFMLYLQLSMSPEALAPTEPAPAELGGHR